MKSYKQISFSLLLQFSRQTIESNKQVSTTKMQIASTKERRINNLQEISLVYFV